MVEVEEAVGEPVGPVAADLFDDQVDGFGAAVGVAAGAGAGQHLGLPGLEGVRPRRATSGIGQLGKLAITFSAMARPRSAAAW